MAATLLAMAAGAGALAGEVLQVAITDTAPPFAYRDDKGALKGFNVDLVNALCQRLQRQCKIEVLRFPEVIPAVSSGRYDLGVANTLRTPEREKLVRFSRVIWRSTSSLLGRRELGGAPLAALLKQESTCAIAGSRQLTWLDENARTPPLAASGNQELLKLLGDKQCTLALMPTQQALAFLQGKEGQAFAYIGAPLADSGLGGDVHMVLRPGKDGLKAEVDNALDALISDGTHERLSRRHFPYSIL
ncbi:substrate-binding periplasmic protein [Azonexus sp.]|uniref:substrate-binding periplasmic protein n=1 Tax=Azonexus sp. TaxID=1872668 RepID=UPI0035B4367D